MTVAHQYSTLKNEKTHTHTHTHTHNIEHSSNNQYTILYTIFALVL